MENEKQIIVKYMGGLGNQMFQYAIGEAFRNEGYRVRADIRWYKNRETVREFLLPQVFSKVSLDYIDSETVEKYEYSYKNRSFLYKLYQHFFINNKLVYYEREPYVFDKKIWGLKDAIIEGYWQSYKYFDGIKEKLWRDFLFPEINSREMAYFSDKISENNVASLHIRGGDYLTAENRNVFGNGCNETYYLKAIEIIKRRNPKVVFWGFTNDIDYAKKIVGLKEVKWHNRAELEEYPDWMDMYLMSLCRYNILANSSFSWWAAYLNRNSERLVIAPKEWYNLVQKDDICPKEWIRL